MPVIDLKNCIIRIKDGSTHFIDVKIGNGNITYTEKKNLDYIRDRGRLDQVRLGDEEPMDVRLDAQWEFITGDGEVTVEDALKQRGDASDWVSTSADPCEPYAVDVQILNNVPCTGVDDEIITLPEFRHTSIEHDPKAGTLAITGTSNATEATVTRAATVS